MRNYKNKKITRKRGKGVFFKTRKSRVIVEGEKYIYRGYDEVLKVIKKYKTTLAPGWTVQSVDAAISKYLDEPRNQDEVKRAGLWTQYILHNKAYNKSTGEFEAFLIKLKSMSLLH